MVLRTSNGTAYELSGPKGAPLVVLIHGLGLNRRMWQWHEKALAERYRVLNFDLHCHGESTRPRAAPSLMVFSEQIVELLDHLGERQAALVGFSLGGMINRRLAIDHSERASAIAILNSPHERSPEQQRIVEERAADTAAGGPAANLEHTLERWFTPEFRAERPDVIAMVRRWVLANEPAPYAQCRMVLAKGVIELVRPNPPIATPTLVMTSENDAGSTPAMSQAIASEIAGAETVIVPSLKHMGLVERPELFTAPVMRFLQRTLG